jgi:hypothetical protein
MRYSRSARSFAAAMVFLVSGLVSGTVLGAPAQPANQYELTGPNLQVTYTLTSLTGDPLLSYQDSKRTLIFRGDDIRVVKTEIATQVTVTLDQVPDLQTVTFTLLIPAINLDENPTLFKTKAITTVHRTSIGGPQLVKGQVQSYRVQALLGKARHVAFAQILEPQSGITGEVTLSPTCPGPQRPGQTCVEPFVGALVQVLNQHKLIIGETRTDESGLFAFDVRPGHYVVHVAGLNNKLPRCPDARVAVLYGADAHVHIGCDTGIR